MSDFLTAVAVKKALFWVVTACSSTAALPPTSFLLGHLFYMKDGSDMCLRNIGISLNYKALKPRRPYQTVISSIYFISSKRISVSGL
jgi:hypothetical protein